MTTDRPGKTPVIIAITLTLFISALTLAVDPDVPSVIRMVLTCVLAWFIYQGHNWARWTIMVLVVLAVLLIGYVITVLPLPDYGIAILLALAAIDALIVALLFVREWGGQYFTPATQPPD